MFNSIALKFFSFRQLLPEWRILFLFQSLTVLFYHTTSNGHEKLNITHKKTENFSTTASVNSKTNDS